MISLVLALLAQPTVPMESSELYYLEDFGGGPSESGATNTTAITNAFAHLATYNQADGGQILFNCGEYDFSTTINVDTNVRMTGQTGQQYNCTTLKFPSNTSGVKFRMPSTSTYGNSTGAILEAVEVEGSGGTSTTAHGIFIEAPNITIRDVRTRLFSGDCFHIDADVTRTPATNANLFELTNIEAVNCTGWCYHAQGGDSNAGYITGSNFHACTTGTIWEDSFIGNVWIGNHFDTDGDCGDEDPETDCGIFVDGTSSRNVFFANYAEGSFDINIPAPSMYTGAFGAGVFSNPAGYYERGNVVFGTAKVFLNVDDNTEIRIGNVSPGTGLGVMEWDANDFYVGNPNCATPSLCDRDPQAIRLGYEPNVNDTTDSLIGWWCHYPQNTGGNSFLCYATDRVDDHDSDLDGLTFEQGDGDESDDPEEMGQLWFRGNGFWMGGSTGLNSTAADRRILVNVVSSKPTRTDLPAGSFAHYSPPSGTRTSIMGWLWNGARWVAK